MAYKRRKRFGRRKSFGRRKLGYRRRRPFLRLRRRRTLSRRLNRGLEVTHQRFITNYVNVAPPSSGLSNFTAVGSHFKLTDLGTDTGIGKFTVLFKQYKITKVVTKFINAAPAKAEYRDATGDEQTAGFWRFWHAPDPTGKHDVTGGLPDDINEARQWSGFKEKPGGANVTMVNRPCTLTQLYENSTNTAYSARKMPWVDIADSGTRTYGFIWGYSWQGDSTAGGALPPAYASNTPHAKMVQVKMYVKFRGRFQD
jgi:hypothetical protein